MKNNRVLPENIAQACEKHWQSGRRTENKNALLACLGSGECAEASALLKTLDESGDKAALNAAADSLRSLLAAEIEKISAAAGAADILQSFGADAPSLREALRSALLTLEYARDRIAAPWIDQADVAAAMQAIGVEKGDLLLVHSSYTKLGHVIGGPQAVVDGLLNAIGPEGTLVMPTLIQNNFEHAYEEWHMDRPSDVGFLTEFFRKQPGALRSDQATHSVAAMGRCAREITEGHCAFGPRLCLFGEYAFGHSSPWQKMHDMGGKVLFLGAKANTNTFKHFIECCQVERRIEAVKDPALRQELIDGLWKYEEFARVVAGETVKAWPMYQSIPVTEVLEAEGFVRRGSLGNADLLCMDIQTMVRETTRVLEADLGRWYPENAAAWFAKADSYAGR